VVGTTFVRNSSDNREGPEDMGIEIEGKLVGVGVSALHGRYEGLEDAFWRAVMVPGATADSSKKI